MRILDRNVRERFAEIDIIAEDHGTLCFVEVRTRKNTRLGHPSETIGPAKQRSVRRAAEAYLARRKLNANTTAVRFDAITVVWDTGEVTHFENAF
jgi:putative endonuclease